MPIDYPGVPLATGLLPANLNAQIAQGADPGSVLGAITPGYKEGADLGYQQRVRNVFRNGLPRDPVTGQADYAKAAEMLTQASGRIDPELLKLQLMRDIYSRNPLQGAAQAPDSSVAPQSAPVSGSFPRSTATQAQPSATAASAPSDTSEGLTPGQVATANAPGNPNLATPRQLAANTGGNAAVIAKTFGVGVDDPIDMGNLQNRQRVVQTLRPTSPSAPPQGTPAQPGLPAGQAPAGQPGPPLDVGVGRPAPYVPRDPTYGGLTLPGMDAGRSIATLRTQAGLLDAMQRGGGQALRDQANDIQRAVEADTAAFRKSQEELFGAGGKALGEQVAAAQKAGELAFPKIQNLNVMLDALNRGGGNISGGPFAQQALKLKQSLSELFGINVEGLNESETVSKIGFGLATQVVRALTARPTQLEVGMALNNNPGLLLTPSGSRIMIDILRQQAAQESDLSRLASNRANWENWPEVQQRYYATHPLLSPFNHRTPLGINDFRQAATEAAANPPAAPSPPKPSGKTSTGVPWSVQ